MSRWLPALCAALATGLFAGRPRAEEIREARLEYQAPPSCPPGAEVETKVGARTPKVRWVPDASARRFRIEVEATEAGYVGRLSSVDGAGIRTEREVAGASCGEVVDALGLVLALAVDPSAMPAAPASAPVTPAPTVAPAQDTGPVREGAPPRAGNTLSLAVGLGVGAVQGIGPEPLMSVGLFLEAGRRGPSTWQPTLRLGAARASSGAVDVPASGSARFTWTVATLDACPLRWSYGSLGFTPCVRADVGELAGRGSNIATPRSDARIWADVGPLGRAEWALLPWAFVDLEGGGAVALTRPRFHFDAPDVTVHQPSSLGVAVAAHAGGRFP